MTESGDPAVGALSGLIRVLAYEHPDLRATLVDLDAAADAVERLAAEFGSSGGDDVIAWRGQRRLSHGSLARRSERPAQADRPPGGSYIVTGGLGGIGTGRGSLAG